MKELWFDVESLDVAVKVRERQRSVCVDFYLDAGSSFGSTVSARLWLFGDDPAALADAVMVAMRDATRA